MIISFIIISIATLSIIVKSALCFNRSCADSVESALQAQCNGVAPNIFCSFIFTPAFINISQHFTEFENADKWINEFWSFVLAFKSAPAEIRSSRVSISPIRHAICPGVYVIRVSKIM
jgi:hypothetical protein